MACTYGDAEHANGGLNHIPASSSLWPHPSRQAKTKFYELVGTFPCFGVRQCSLMLVGYSAVLVFDEFQQKKKTIITRQTAEDWTINSLAVPPHIENFNQPSPINIRTIFNTVYTGVQA